MSKSFKELQKQWYKKLKETGFEDIEDSSQPVIPLKEWHKLKFKKINLLDQNSNEKYYKLVTDFVNKPSFENACKFIVKHGNCKFSYCQIVEIWELHCEGHTRRNIAKRFGRVKSRIDSVIGKLREWMNLI